MKLICLNRLNRRWMTLLDHLQTEFRHIEVITDQSDAEKSIQTATAVIADRFSRNTLQKAQQLEMIFVPYAGIDALPLDQIKQRRIRVANIHGNAPYVAERAVALALTFYGKIIEYHNDLKHAHWHGFWVGKGARDTWDSIDGKTCAIIGAGQIGQQIAKRLKPFGCRTLGFRRSAVAQTLTYFDEITLDLEHAIRQSELVFVCLPLTPATRGIFNENLLGRMADKFLVNVGRGELVDESALYQSLEKGILKGAAIDTWYRYPQKGDAKTPPSIYPLSELPNVILSPHVAGFTSQSAQLNIEGTMENIRSYLKTGHPKWEVDIQQMY